MGWIDSRFHGDNLPVESITWLDAVRYGNERSKRDGYPPAYTISNPSYDGSHLVDASVTWNQAVRGYRLLTESEWE